MDLTWGHGTVVPVTWETNPRGLNDLVQPGLHSEIQGPFLKMKSKMRVGDMAWP